MLRTNNKDNKDILLTLLFWKLQPFTRQVILFLIFTHQKLCLATAIRNFRGGGGAG